jgi:nucleotide-binding universal stress UspA family protein
LPGCQEGGPRGAGRMGCPIFHSVIVGFDGSEQARDALALGAALTAADGELLVCCVHRFNMLSAQIDITEPRLDRAAAELCAKEAVRLLHGPFKVGSVLVEGAGAALMLQRVVSQRDADLLVLGSSHRGAAGRVLLGSVTEEALHLAHGPVAVAPVGYRRRSADARLARIAVGYDLASPPENALVAAAALAEQEGAELRVVAVADTDTTVAARASGGLSYAALLSARRGAGQEGLAHALAGLPEDLSASSEVRDGEAAEKLLEVTHGVDLLVLGSSGGGFIRRMALGSVCDAVVRAAACPVLVMSATEAAEAHEPRADGPLPHG